MGVLKISVFILGYFFARIAFSACENYNHASSSVSICQDEKSKALISESCLKRDCDARKFLNQHKKAKMRDSVNPVKACEELRLPAVVMQDSQGKSTHFCLFNDGSSLEASMVEKLVN